MKKDPNILLFINFPNLAHCATVACLNEQSVHEPPMWVVELEVVILSLNLEGDSLKSSYFLCFTQ